MRSRKACKTRTANEAGLVGDRRDAEEKMKVILIVDDEVDITATFAILFELHGFEVLSAPNGLQALDVIEKRTPDIIVSDCMMPIMDGLEFSRRVRGNPATQKIPIVLMSAAPAQHRLGSAEFDLFLKKPFRFNDLLAEVTKLLESR
jgi:CheY-like chemotaxis protein